MTRERALELFKQYAWDDSDFAQKEVTRYQSNYGQATAYMIGQLDIWRLRNETENTLGDKYDIKEFHLQVLSQGSSPLQYLKSHIKKYLECKNDTSQEFCNIVINPKLSSSDPKPYMRNMNMKWPMNRHEL